MELEYIILYYLVVFAGICFYLLKREKRLCISDGVMIVCTIMFSVSGLMNSYGIYENYNSLNNTLYNLYLLNAIITPVGLICGKNTKIVIPSSDKSNTYSISNYLIVFSVIFIVLYSIGYFIIIRDDIPLLMLFHDDGASSAAFSRLRVTHNFGSYYNDLFIYRYRSLFFNIISLYIFSVIHVKFLLDKSKYLMLFLIFTTVVLFLQIYSTEKGPFIYMIVIATFNIVEYRHLIKNEYAGTNQQKDNIESKKLPSRHRSLYIILLLCSTFVFLILYNLFMGKETYESGLSSFFKRTFVQQSSSIYLQDIMLEKNYNGCLYGRGLPLTFIDGLIKREPVNLAKEAYEIQYEYYIDTAGAGSSGSLGLFYYYSNFGYGLSIMLFFIINYFIGYMDSYMHQKILSSPNRELNISFYSIVGYLMFQGAIGHYQTIVQFPLIIAPPFIVILILNYMFKNTQKISNMHVQQSF